MRVVLYEGPGAQALGGERRDQLMGALLDAGHAFARPAEGQQVSPPAGECMVLLGEFAAGSETSVSAPEGAEATSELFVEDISGLSAGDVTERIGGLVATPEPDTVDGAAPAAKAPGAWMPWFPVIDYQRCTNCMQCLSFCLFDVYGVDKQGQIEVRNEEKCKTNCPACSRVCPEVAILFPKYGKGPINGDVVRAADVETEAMKVDISALLGGDIYSSLRQRRDDAKKRFSTERDESRALLERKRCLKKLKKDLDIPDEVLMTLPSAGDIADRAERAKEKMEKRMARSQTVRDARPAPTEDEWGI